MLNRSLKPISVAIFLGSLCLPATAAELNGPARVVDSGNLEIGGQAVTLAGIRAPAESTTCPRGGQTWRCGQQAAWALAERIERHWVLCDEQRTCFIGGRAGINLNRWLVEQGWAEAADPAYVPVEQSARQAGRGLWAER
jgi:endonuclease YncB( thermonuclease family)